MKLVTIYQVSTDEKFLVELLDDDLTLEALRTVVQDRGTSSFLWVADESVLRTRFS